MKKIFYSVMFLAVGALAFPQQANALLASQQSSIQDGYCVDGDCTITSSGGGGGGTTYSSSGGTSSSNTCTTVLMTSDGTFSSSLACNNICSVSCKTCTSNGVTKYYCAPPSGGTQHQIIDDPIDLSSCTLLNCATCIVSPKGLKTCTKCNAGYVPSSGTCGACAAGTYSTDGLTCTQCPAGTSSSTTANGIGCSICAKGTYSSAGATSCTSCPSGKTTISTGATSSSSCVYPESCCDNLNKTTGCTTGIQSVSTQTCKTCASKYGTGCSTCSITACEGCSAGYFKPSGASACQLCPKGPYCPGGTATTTTDCPPGTSTQTTGAKSASECVAPSTCPSGTTLYTSYPSNMCATTLECMDSGTKKYYCNGCKDGYTWVTGPNGCSPMSCPSGKTLSTSKPSNCSNYGACVSSGSVKYYCNSCNSGYTLDVTQGCVPTQNCAADFPIPNGTCTACGDTECSKATCDSSDLVFAGQIDWPEGCICKTSGYVYNKSTKKCEAPSTPDIGSCPSEVATYTSCPSECASCNKCTSNGSTKYMCTSCIDGYILNSCGAGKASMCTVQNCGPGKYLEGSSCTGSCKTCPAGYYCDGSTKKICSAGTYSEGGASSCTTCQAGSSSLTTGGTSSSSCTMCMVLFPLDHLGMCTQCNPSGCTAGLCGGEEGTEWSSSAHNCVVAGCPAGQYMSGGTCKTCPSGTDSDPGSTSCYNLNEKCASICGNSGYKYGRLGSKTASNGRQEKVCSYYPLACDQACTNSWDIRVFVSGEFTCQEAQQTPMCNAGKYVRSDGKCEGCPSMTYQPNDNYTGSTCTSCPKGTYSVNAQGSGAAQCSACPADDAGVALECKVDGYNVYNTALDCNPGYAAYFPFGKLECIECGPGTYSAGGPGYYETKSGNYGKAYSQGPMGLTCPNKCPAGTYNDLRGQTSKSACKQCPPGTFSAEQGAAECTECAYGAFSKPGATSCYSCATEHPLANGKCENCDATGCTEISCNDGYTAVNGVCVSNEKYCAINFPIKNGECTACGDTECSKATCNSEDLVFAGQIDWFEGCVCKQSGYEFNKLSGKCEPTSCEQGYYVSGGVCTKCEEGFACNGVTREVCPAGTASDGPGANQCHACVATGTYTTGEAVACLACGPGKTDYNHQGCIDCPEGKMCTQNCTANQPCIEDAFVADCGAGYYSEKGATSCLPCGNGYYCPDGKASTRKRCPSGTYTKTETSTKAEDCLTASGVVIENGICTEVTLDGHCTAAKCNDGGFFWNPTTQQCDMGCSFANGSCASFDGKTCTCKKVGECNPGYIADTDPTTAGSYICRKSCDEGMYINPANLGCVKEETQTSCVGAAACEVCPAGYSCAGGKADKVECTAGTYSRENAKVCSPCTEIVLYDDEMNASGTCAACSKAYGYCEVTSCNDNTYPILTGAGEHDFTCYKCPKVDLPTEMMTTLQGVATQTGTYSIGAEMISDKNAAEQVSCKSCILDAKVDNGYCLNCGYVGGKPVCNVTLEGAVVCNPGYQLSASGTCEACPSGTFKEGYNAKQCTSCSDYVQTNSVAYSDITTTENIAATEAQVATANKISGGYITRVKVDKTYVSVGATSFSQCRLNADALDLVTCKEPLQRSENSCCCVKP